ncbi:hypothetical protein [Pleurocapsa sp. FMAR1]|uniref:hypothetical protein n=1 Tax=Pleurocapsa sp. FMAR1 TaxID=3040204 RepID=UPI0029C9ACA2|nr:hypothetical protein [Pleurocapsa sp. FMAR1]
MIVSISARSNGDAVSPVPVLREGNPSAGNWRTPKVFASAFLLSFLMWTVFVFSNILIGSRGSHPKQLHLIQLDNGRWHIWSELNLPDNVILIF